MVIYRLVVLILLPLMLLVGPLLSRKVRQGLSLRLFPRPQPDWLGQEPTLWIHCASGEFEYAKPLIRQWKKDHPDMRIVVSYFSPTYHRNIENFPGVDWSFPLPLDLPGPCGSQLKKVKPKLVLIARTDLWPEFLHQCKSLKIPTILFAATSHPKPGVLGIHNRLGSWRLQLLTQIYCVSETDATHLHQINPSLKAKALGDPRYDQVLARLKNPKALKEHLKPAAPHPPTLVAGSTWSEDEDVLLNAITPLLKEQQFHLVIAPHEPTPQHLSKLQHKISKQNLNFQLYSAAQEFRPGSILIIDQVGILAELYQWGQLALVGGSFKGSVHSVMEPIAAGCLTAVGPYHLNNREAVDLQNVRTPQGLSMVSAHSQSTDLRQWLKSVTDLRPEEWVFINDFLRQEITRRSGATSRLIDELKDYL